MVLLVMGVQKGHSKAQFDLAVMLEEGRGQTPVLSGLRADNVLYTKLRQRDLIQESYGSKSIIKRLIEDIKDLAYF